MGYGISHKFGGARSLVSIGFKTSFGGQNHCFIPLEMKRSKICPK